MCEHVPNCEHRTEWEPEQIAPTADDWRMALDREERATLDLVERSYEQHLREQAEFKAALKRLTVLRVA